MVSRVAVVKTHTDNNEYEARTARNPRTGEQVSLPARVRPHFKPGKALRERVDAAMAGDRGG